MKRLEHVASFIAPYKIIADIGCDHGYLIDIAFKQNIITKAYAIDNKIGPLNQAKANLNSYEHVTYLLQDGLATLDKDCEVVILAGMGGILVNNIINSGFSNLKNVKRIIVEANKDSNQVRENLYNHGYKIIQEDCLVEENQYYEIDVFEKNDGCIYSKEELFFGPLLIKNKPKDFMDMWQTKYNKLKDIPQKQDYCKKINKMLQNESY